MSGMMKLKCNVDIVDIVANVDNDANDDTQTSCDIIRHYAVINSNLMSMLKSLISSAFSQF